MAINRAHRLTRIDYWPGFVDAMATLLLVFVFLLSVFILAQFFLGQEVTSKDTVLTRLNAQIAELTDLLALEKSSSRDLQETLATLQANLATSEGERGRLQGLIDSSGAAEGAAAGRITSLEGDLKSEQEVSQHALAQVELLNQQIAALRRQLCGARGGAQRLGEPQQREPDADRRSRPAAQRGAGAARAGAVAVPFGLLRDAAENPRRPARHRGRRRPLRAAGLGALLHARATI